MKHFLFMALVLIVLMPFGCKKSDTNNQDHEIGCNTKINSDLILSNPLEVDISSNFMVEKLENQLFFSGYGSAVGKIISYNLKAKSFNYLNGQGKGPFEFLFAGIYAKDTILYITDPLNTKVAKYNITNNEFVIEIALNDFINGHILNVNRNLEKIYFLTSQRDRSISNDTFNYLLVFDTQTESLDTIMTFKDEWRLNHFDPIAKSDISTEYHVYKNKIIGEVSGELVVAESDEFAIRSLIDTTGIYSKVDFHYVPDYEHYIQSIIDKYSDDSDGNGSRRFLNQIKKAIRGASKDYTSLYKSILFGDSHVLYGLFNENNVFLLHSVKDSTTEAKVICADPNIKPVLIADGEIFWHKQDFENHIYELRKTNISEL